MSTEPAVPRLIGGGRAVASSRSRPRAVTLFAAWLVAAVVLIPLPAHAAEPELVARVNGEPVRHREWTRMLADPLTVTLYRREHGNAPSSRDELGRWALQELVNKRLMLQEAARRGFRVSDDDVDRAVAAWRARFKREAKFESWLKVRALDKASLREIVRTDLLIARVRAALMREPRIGDAEIRAYYDVHAHELTRAEAVRLSIIVVRDRPGAADIVAAARRGEDWQRLAQERSIASRAAEFGNGLVSVASLPEPLRVAVAALAPGEVTEPLQGSGDFIVARLEERRPAGRRTLDEARAEIEQRLLATKQREVVRAWLIERQRTSAIEVFTPIADAPQGAERVTVVSPASR